MLLPEVILWQALRRNAQGLRFRRQHAAGPYIADFYCFAAKLIVEVDGEADDREDRPERDAVRDTWFAEQGIAVLRISAKDVLTNLEGVVAYIVDAAKNPPPRGEVAAQRADGGGSTSRRTAPSDALRAPPPPKGEDLL